MPVSQTEKNIDILRCPQCSGKVDTAKNCLQCRDCKRSYTRTGGTFDFRLREEKRVEQTFTVGPFVPPADSIFYHPLSPSLVHGVTPDQLQQCIPDSSGGSKGRALDFGCGSGRHQAILENKGYEWFGIDIDPDSTASYLGDGHALPFQSETFDVVFSVAAFEHLQNPFVAISEIGRVLKPGGTFLGSMAFSEGFHSASHFHPTHYGVHQLLQSANLDVEHVYPYNISKERWWGWVTKGLNWEPPTSYTRDLFRPFPMWFRAFTALPYHWVHHVYYALGSRVGSRIGVTENDPKTIVRTKLLRIAGQYCFVAQKPQRE